MKKTLLLILSILFLAGLVMNIQYAVNDYGIKTNNLHNFILADGTDGTSEVVVSCCPDCTQSGVCWTINLLYKPGIDPISKRCKSGAPMYSSCNCSN